MMTLDSFQKKKEYLICVDSDGCAMDTMDIKHIRCFGPCMVTEWGLEAWETLILERWNTINLYSMTRGINRFKGLAMALQEIDEKYTKIEDLETLLSWTEHASELSNQSVKDYLKQKDSLILAKALAWSEAVNQCITAIPESEKPAFEGVREGLEKAHRMADVAIVSSANLQAVLDEWKLYGLLEHTDIVLAQDAGSKAYCIQKLTEKGYDKAKVLMLGDAPGDRAAAVWAGVHYYPILVRKEQEYWNRFVREGLPKFSKGEFAGAYQEELLKEFEENLS
ncbi:MAG: HAD hydrolase-like protein [Hungatella sp.]